MFEAVGRGRSKAGIHEKSHAKKASEPIVKKKRKGKQSRERGFIEAANKLTDYCKKGNILSSSAQARERASASGPPT